MVATDSAFLSVGSSVQNWGSTSRNAHGQKCVDRGYPYSLAQHVTKLNKMHLGACTLREARVAPFVDKIR